jgi:hypothetical protein
VEYFSGHTTVLEAGLPKEVLVRVTEDGEYMEVTKTCSGKELKVFPARRRSVSPEKREALGGRRVSSILQPQRRSGRPLMTKLRLV